MSDPFMNGVRFSGMDNPWAAFMGAAPSPFAKKSSRTFELPEAYKSQDSFLSKCVEELIFTDDGGGGGRRLPETPLASSQKRLWMDAAAKEAEDAMVEFELGHFCYYERVRGAKAVPASMKIARKKRPKTSEKDAVRPKEQHGLDFVDRLIPIPVFKTNSQGHVVVRTADSEPNYYQALIGAQRSVYEGHQHLIPGVDVDVNADFSVPEDADSGFTVMDGDGAVIFNVQDRETAVAEPANGIQVDWNTWESNEHFMDIVPNFAPSNVVSARRGQPPNSHLPAAPAA